MDGRTEKNARIDEDGDRLSRLSDELIHRILSFLDTRLAVQTSILSNRWKLIWTTLPFLEFKQYGSNLSKQKLKSSFSDSVTHVLSCRNHESQVLKLKLKVPSKFPDLTEKVIKYAISHNVKELDVYLKHSHQNYKLSTFTSNSIEKLKLRVRLDKSCVESDCWDLPALTTLHWVFPFFKDSYAYDLWFSCLVCLPALTTLRVDGWKYGDYLKLPGPVSLPGLRTLHITNFEIPEKFWDLPALVSLELDDVRFSHQASKFFSELVSLQNLNMCFRSELMSDVYISCPQLVNLRISNEVTYNYNVMAIVSAPKLRNFSSVGIFPITFGDSELENVNITLPKLGRYRKRQELENYCKQFRSFLPVLGNAKVLTLDLNIVQALSLVSDLLVYFASPFYNLKYVKLPQGYKESSLSSTTKSYLLGGSPGATIVTTLPQNDVNAHRTPVSQNVVFQDPLATASKEMVDTDTAIQVGALVQRFGEVVTNAPVGGSDNDRASSSRANCNSGLWKGYEVNSNFVDLLDLIMKKYPETFEQLTSKSKKLCTMKLNMLCTLVNDFTKISMTEVDSEMIAEYREHFADLQRSFNVTWLVNRLNNIEHIQSSQPLVHELHAIESRIGYLKSNLKDLQSRIDDAKCELHDLQTLRLKKITEIEKAFGTLGATISDSAGYIGVDLLSGP